ncbi:hypothetical protein [Anaerolactibacter massiliensis]|uniref:hypothetical protein n=1 Tax=Anaerolactibacter massiliensis TaxID=2044573 RepID=UPI000CF8ADB3|nr:hypothetical protein [Anaerolactibacter massiliensis]
MTRRYIQSFISMKYARVLPMLSFVIFACAFIYFRRGTQNAKTAALIAACILIVVMFFYYKAKFTVNREWKKIPDAKEFDDSIMLGYAFLLEQRMLVFDRNHLHLYVYENLKKASLQEENHGKLMMHVTDGNDDSAFELSTKEQAGRVAAFLKAHHPDLELEGVNAAGEGTLRSIDPYRNEK